MTGLGPFGLDLFTTVKARKRSFALLAILSLWTPFISINQSEEQPPPVMIVPGGTTAIARLLGPLDLRHEFFAGSLNHFLLTEGASSGEWQFTSSRNLLDEYLRAMSTLRERFGDKFTFKPGTKISRRMITAAAKELGFQIETTEKKIILDLEDGNEWRIRRAIVRALGWDFPNIVLQFEQNEPTTLSIPVETVPAPLPFPLWSQLVGSPVTPENAMEYLVRDQPSGLLAKGFESLTPETQGALPAADWIFIAREAGIPFSRYAAAIEIEDGRLRVPGGPAAEPAWAELVGAPVSPPGPFVRRLLALEGGRAAYLWHAFFFAPQSIQDGFFADPEAKTALIQISKSLGDERLRADFSRTQARHAGLFSLLWSFESGSERAVELKGQVSFWEGLLGQKLAPLPGKETPSLSLPRFCQGAVTAQYSLGKVQRLALELLAPIAGWVTESPPPLPAEELPKLLEVAFLHPRALDPWLDFNGWERNQLPAYLDAVRNLSNNARTIPDFESIVRFQGGIEILRGLVRAEKVTPDKLSAPLEDWLTLHRSDVAPASLFERQYLWLEGLIRALPSPEPDAVGRGPLEQKVLAALAPQNDPQVISWNGLTYKGTRNRDRRRAMLGMMREQGVPAIDHLAALRHLFAAMESAARSNKASDFRKLAQETDDLVLQLPPPIGTLGTFQDGWFKGTQLMSLREKLATWSKLAKPENLESAGNEAGAAFSLLARELTAIFAVSPFFDGFPSGRLTRTEGRLVRTHSLLHQMRLDIHRSDATDSPWQDGRVFPKEEKGLGFRTCGFLGDVPRALAPFEVTAPPGLARSRGQAAALAAAWYPAIQRIRWADWTLERTRLLHAVLNAGKDLIDRGFEEHRNNGRGPHWTLVGRVIPHGRLQALTRSGASTTIGPSERLSVAMAALLGQGDQPAAPELLEPQTRQGLAEALAAAGGDWNQALSPFFPVLPAVDGWRSRPRLFWPSYEGLAAQSPRSALQQRMLLDFLLAIGGALARFNLPGDVGADLANESLLELATGPTLENPADWAGLLSWVNQMNDSFFGERLNRCFAKQFYSASF